MSSVDVIVPCYNYARFLKQSVESVLGQSCQTRVLIINDASSDNSREVATDLARQDTRVTFLDHARNKGHIASYNEGIEWLSGQYYLLLSADDYLLPGALERATALMDADPDMAFTFGRCRVRLPDGTEYPHIGFRGQGRGNLVIEGTRFIRRYGTCNIVPVPTAIVRTSVQRVVGGYRPELPHSGDLEMWLRLAAHGSVGFVDAEQAVYRRHSANMSDLYNHTGMLPDLRQRRLALDMFFAHNAHRLANPDALARTLRAELGRIGLKRACSAFNSGEDEAVEQLAAFAIETSPASVRSFDGARLAIRRALGPRPWRQMRAARDQLRALVARR